MDVCIDATELRTELRAWTDSRRPRSCTFYVANRGIGELVITDVCFSGPVEVARYPATVDSGAARLSGRVGTSLLERGVRLCVSV